MSYQCVFRMTEMIILLVRNSEDIDNVCMLFLFPSVKHSHIRAAYEESMLATLFPHSVHDIREERK